MRKRLSIICLLVAQLLSAQITPPGLGSLPNADSWFAVGLRENLDTASRFQSMTYVGFGRQSKSSDFNPVKQQGILVLNQEFYHHFSEHWKYSFALSYRQQNEYKDIPAPGEAAPLSSNASPLFKREFRVYGRYLYLVQTERIKYAVALRQEFRKFFTPDFTDWQESLQLRTRLKAQCVVNLNKNKMHRLTLGCEVLGKTSKKAGPDSYWTKFGYAETRLSFFYSFAPKNAPVICSIGYMDEMIDAKNISYLSFDIIIENMFGILKHDKSRLVEYSE